MCSRRPFPRSARWGVARWLLPLLLVGLACFGVPGYDTHIAAAVKSAMPADFGSRTPALAPERPGSREPERAPGSRESQRPPVGSAGASVADFDAAASWPPFVRVVPQMNSDDVMVYAEGIGRAYQRLGADFGDTSHTWSHTDLEYSEMEELYRGLAERALSEPCALPEGCLQVYAYTAGGGHGPSTTIAYEFAVVGPAVVPDLELYTARLRFADPPFTDGVTHTVILQIPPKEPAGLSGGWRILEGGLYEVESDGVDGQLRASLAIRYDPDWLDWYGIEPGDLRLWRWDAAQGAWVMLDSSVNTRLYRVSASIDALTAYALAAPSRAAVWLPLISSAIRSSN